MEFRLMIEQGIIGIVTGILTTVTLFVIKSFWTFKVTPFLKSIRYQGVQIDGKWSGLDENTDSEKGEIYKSEFNLFIKQNAHELTGSCFFQFKNEHKDASLEFNVTGYIWEGYVTLNFTPRDKRITSYATTLLKLHDGGHSLKGTWLFRDVEKEFVNSVPMVIFRDAKNS
jgi:hypothetical protein